MKKVKHYAKHSRQASILPDGGQSLQCFVPHHNEPDKKPELYEAVTHRSDRITTGNKKFELIELSDITYYRAGRMNRDDANWIRNFRSFVLGMLRGGLGFIKCQSYEAAKRYSNLGGYVALVKTNGAQAWGVVK